MTSPIYESDQRRSRIDETEMAIFGLIERPNLRVLLSIRLVTRAIFIHSNANRTKDCVQLNLGFYLRTRG
jgi:hypothetical protein